MLAAYISTPSIDLSATLYFISSNYLAASRTHLSIVQTLWRPVASFLIQPGLSRHYTICHQLTILHAVPKVEL